VPFLAKPGEPTNNVSSLVDEFFPSNYGDNVAVNVYERPFQLDNTYRGDADIQNAQMADNGDWYIFTTRLMDINPATKEMDTPYGIEIDTDKDGRGDLLIWATPPYSLDWTKTNIQVFMDLNNDVGGPHPLLADVLTVKGDGYETLVFDRGAGKDIDTAWVRMSPAHITDLQIAVKKTTIPTNKFMWNSWMDFGLATPALFEYNDYYSAKDAGSPYAANPNYPIKALFGMDNTCRAAYGFTPVGNEPDLCKSAQPTAQATRKPSITNPPPVPGSINGIVFFDNNANGVFDGGDTGQAYEMTLYQNGTCGGSAYLGAMPAPDGNYNLTNLPAGTWCLRLQYSGSTVLPANPQVVTVHAGGASTVNFAIQGPG
jgi:hypothetical protein